MGPQDLVDMIKIKGIMILKEDLNAFMKNHFLFRFQATVDGLDVYSINVNMK